MIDEKILYYIERTVEHIRRVQDNMIYLYIFHQDKFDISPDDWRLCLECVMRHDYSKFNEIQFLPYANYSWSIKFKIPIMAKEKKEFNLACQDHFRKENHHPNANQNLYTCTTNEAVEIACDLQAMAQEFGEDSGRTYFEKTWKKNNSQYFYDDYNWICSEAIIRKCFDCFDNRKRVKP